MKKCNKCKEFQPFENYTKQPQYKDGLHQSCKKCCAERSANWRKKNPNNQRNAALKHRYGIELDEYQFMLMKQQGGCAICGVVSHANGKPLFVDHAHDSGKIRGILCTHCNTMIGNAKDNPDLLRKAALYLEENIDE